jgi:hypothetical protein
MEEVFPKKVRKWEGRKYPIDDFASLNAALMLKAQITEFHFLNFQIRKTTKNRKRDPIKDSNLVLRFVDSSPYLTFSEESSTMKKNFAFFCLLQELLSVFRSGQINR